MKSVTLQIVHSSGKPGTVTAEVIWTDGKFATHAAPSYVNTSGVTVTGGFTATHIASGASVSLVMPTEAHARVFAQWLSGLDCDWSAKKPDFSEVPKCLANLREWVQKRVKAPSIGVVKNQARTLSYGRITRLPGA